MRIGIVTLGCDKNLVDSEHLAGILSARGHEVYGQGVVGVLDVLVLYTCGFIEEARAQNLETTLAYCETKEKMGNPRRIVMAGCLSQRWGEEIAPELEGVDAFAGVGRPRELADLIEKIGDGAGARGAASATKARSIASPDMKRAKALPRARLDASPSTYLKVSDGCDHACAFCAIPEMKGPYASVPREMLLDEAKRLVDSGAREINLIGQDIAPYGKDLYDAYGLPELLRDLCRIEGDFRLRLLYFYPSGLNDRFLDVFDEEPKICKYLDMPLQHFDPGILKAMRRPSSEFVVREGLNKLRERVPETALRTTVIVGFPGETSKAFKNLIAGVEELQFDWLGAFIFSPEEGTAAADFPDRIAGEKAEKRFERVMKTQSAVTAHKQERQIGRALRVLIEEASEDGRHFFGRSYREAPEVDGIVVVESADPDAPAAVEIGDLVNVRIVEAEGYDLVGRVEGDQA